MPRRWFIIVITMLDCLILLTGCTGNQDSTTPFEHEEVTLRVAVNNERSFHDRYGQMLELFYPNLTVELIDEGYYEAYRNGTWSEWIEEHRPDLFISAAPSIYSELSTQGLFVALDPLIQTEHYDLDAFIPAVTEQLRNNANRELYGLATHFQSSAIFYHKQKFDERSIPYPVEKRSWEELLALAAEFASADGTRYGLAIQGTDNPFQLVLMIGETEGLDFLSADDTEAWFRSQGWIKVWQLVLDAVNRQIVKWDPQAHGFPEDAAMFIGDEQMVRDLSGNSALLDIWGMAPYPANPVDPERSNVLQVRNIISIVSSSPNREHAWELLKILTAESVARYGGMAFGHDGLWTRKTLLPANMPGLEAMYEWKPAPASPPKPSELVQFVMQAGHNTFLDLLENGLPLEDALTKLDTETNEFLARTNDEP